MLQSRSAACTRNTSICCAICWGKSVAHNVIKPSPRWRTKGSAMRWLFSSRRRTAPLTLAEQSSSRAVPASNRR